MNLINKSIIPTEKLQKLLYFAAGKNKIDCDVTVKNCKHSFDCDFHYSMSGPDRYYIILRFGGVDFFPLEVELTNNQIKKGYDGYYYFDNLEECIVSGSAHEFQHYKQFQSPVKRGWLRDKDPRAEKYADKAALKVLEDYREKIKENPSYFD